MNDPACMPDVYTLSITRWVSASVLTWRTLFGPECSPQASRQQIAVHAACGTGPRRIVGRPGPSIHVHVKSGFRRPCPPHSCQHTSSASYLARHGSIGAKTRESSSDRARVDVCPGLMHGHRECAVAFAEATATSPATRARAYINPHFLPFYTQSTLISSPPSAAALEHSSPSVLPCTYN